MVNKEVKIVKDTALTDVTRNWRMAFPEDQATVAFKKENSR